MYCIFKIKLICHNNIIAFNFKNIWNNFQSINYIMQYIEVIIWHFFYFAFYLNIFKYNFK